MMRLTTAPGHWPDQLHAERVHLEMTRGANSPGQAALRRFRQMLAVSRVGVPPVRTNRRFFKREPHGTDRVLNPKNELLWWTYSHVVRPSKAI
jgi:hypothetical protein